MILHYLEGSVDEPSSGMAEDLKLVVASENKVPSPILVKICYKEVLTLQKIHVDL